MDDDVRFIVNRYFQVAVPVGLDPLVTLAQVDLETGHLASFWAGRPRCNPAGIGVTGVPNAGVVFGSWYESIPAHVGRLLAYALPVDTGTTAQRALINKALSWRSLPDAKRGQVTTVGGLATTWAADPMYGNKLVAIANRILGIIP